MADKKAEAASLRKEIEAEELRAELSNAPEAKEEGSFLQSAGESLKGFEAGLTQATSLGGRAGALGESVAAFIKGDIGSFEDFSNTYSSSLEAIQAEFAAAGEAAPISNMIGQGIGVASTVGAGGAGAATLKGAAAAGAAEGAIQAAGATEDLATAEAVGDIAIGAGLGATVGAGGAVLGQAATKFASSGKTQARQLLQDLNFPKKAFRMGSGSTRTPEKAFENLIDRGLIPADRLDAKALSPVQLESILQGERATVGASIQAAVETADDILPAIDSNKLGISKLVKDVKALKGLVEAGDDKIALDSLEGTLAGINGPMKLNDLWTVRKIIDSNLGRLAKKGSKDVLESKRLVTLMDGRARIRAEMGKQIDGLAKNNTTLQNILGDKKFLEMGDDYGDVATLGDFVTDLAAAERKAETTFAKSLKENLTGVGTQLGAAAGAGLTAASGGSVGAGLLSGAAISSTIRAASQSGLLEKGAIAAEKGVRKIVSRSGRVLSEVAQRDAAIAGQLYQSYDAENSALTHPDDVRTHIGNIMNNSSMPHAQKFREMNLVQTSGRINPASIASEAKARAERELKMLEEQTDMEALDILKGL